MTDEGSGILQLLGETLMTGWGAIIAALAVASASLVFPGVRWQQQLRREVEILSALADSDIKKEWRRRTRRTARRLAEYRIYVPRWMKIAGWSMTALGIFVGGTVAYEVATTEGSDLPMSVVSDWISLCAIAAVCLITAYFMWSGRDIHGFTPRLRKAMISTPPDKLREIHRRAANVRNPPRAPRAPRGRKSRTAVGTRQRSAQVVHAEAGDPAEN